MKENKIAVIFTLILLCLMELMIFENLMYAWENGGSHFYQTQTCGSWGRYYINPTPENEQAYKAVCEHYKKIDFRLCTLGVIVSLINLVMIFKLGKQLFFSSTSS